MHYLLSKTEQAYLSRTRQFTKAQARCIRYRLNKKLKRDAASWKTDAAAAALPYLDDNKQSAGSGNFVPPSPHQEGKEGNISNPRVLSDMGLAIPRPTRLLPALAGLGDPRSFSFLVSASRISVLMFFVVFLY